MSFYTGTQAEVLWAGPPSNYPAANAASTSAQSLIAGASGDFQQPYLPAGFFQMGRTNQLVEGHLAGSVTASTTATTFGLLLYLNTAPGVITGTFATILTTPLLTAPVTTASQGWELDFRILCRGAGYGTTTVSTSLLCTGVWSAWTLQAVCAPTVTTTVDSTVNQWIAAGAIFSTSSATNSCTLQHALIYGMN
jgi:hypothetical protein